MSHPLSKLFRFSLNLSCAFRHKLSKTGKDIPLAIAYKQDCEILTLEEKEFQVQYLKLDLKIESMESETLTKQNIT